jgi:hypothetical protein
MLTFSWSRAHPAKKKEPKTPKRAAPSWWSVNGDLCLALLECGGAVLLAVIAVYIIAGGLRKRGVEWL